ncbi:Hypothetical predicted protein [Podarcis lilfordi]|uniref:Uncharacterized protein n=1 Tax=Podarcis lilfordi TaxID=74358 RepID=A0AA35LF26_9SAUR|nr:Hypothetical predicted protein [Podarcis lilfordi]
MGSSSVRSTLALFCCLVFAQGDTNALKSYSTLSASDDLPPDFNPRCSWRHRHIDAPWIKSPSTAVPVFPGTSKGHLRPYLIDPPSPGKSP